MNVNKSKYIAALLYFISYCNNKYLGVTKLNKLFYYLDFIYYRDNKKSITGDKYISQKYGPVPSNLTTILDSAKKDGLLQIDEESFSINGEEIKKIKYLTKEKPDMNVFNDKEKELLENIKNEFTSYNTDQIVLQTHLEAPWAFTNEGEKIDYELAHDIEFFK